MLLTLAPLGGRSTSIISIFVQALQFPLNQWATSFDLHVLGMPPAFILSQDQTLNKKKVISNLIPDYSNKLTYIFLLSFQRSFLHFFLYKIKEISHKVQINSNTFKIRCQHFFEVFFKKCQILFFWCFLNAKSAF